MTDQNITHGNFGRRTGESKVAQTPESVLENMTRSERIQITTEEVLNYQKLIGEYGSSSPQAKAYEYSIANTLNMLAADEQEEVIERIEQFEQSKVTSLREE